VSQFSPWEFRHALSIIATSIFFASTGALFGWLGRLLGDVEGQSTGQRPRGSCAPAVERCSRDQDLTITMNVVDLGCSAISHAPEALAGTVGEAVPNAIKHARSSTIIVYVETTHDCEVVASVRSNGCGFDTATVRRWQGLDDSITAQMASICGRQCCWLPAQEITD
jgi:hypothetical protein